MPNPNQIEGLRELKPIEDAQAASSASASAHAELVEAIIASPRAEAISVRPRRRWDRRPLLLAASLAAIAAVLVITVPGLLTGSGSATLPESAQAAILHRIAAALAHRPGTIVVQVEKVHLIPGGGLTRRNVTLTDESITETSSSGRQERTLMTDSGQRRGFVVATNRNLMEIYDPTRATIYATTVRAWLAVILGHLPKGVRPNSTAVGDSPTPGRTSIPEQQLRQGIYRLGGRTTIDGRPALKLIPIPQRQPGSQGTELLPAVYVSPSNYHPIREVLRTPSEAGGYGPAMVTNWTRYSVLPATRANERLVLLGALHPHTRVVRGALSYIAAQRRANKR